jgi:hypothetical protein
MKLKIFILPLLCMCTHFGFSQILNIEDPTLTVDSIKKNDFKFGLGCDFSFTFQHEKVYETNALLESVYHYNDKHQFLLNGQYFNTGTANERLINGGFIHLRYTFGFGKKIAPQGFMQHQLDLGRGLVKRQLIGCNLRWQAVQKDKLSIQLATGAFYENELWNYSGAPEAESGRKISEKLKSNNMLRTYFQLGKQTKISIVNYFQFAFQNPMNQFRLATSISFSTALSDHFQLQFNFMSMFDTKPVVPIDKFYYTLSNGLGVSM